MLALDTGRANRLQHELEDLDITGNAVMAKELGTDLEGIARTLERVGARPQDRSHVAETCGRFPLELVRIDPGDLRRGVGSDAHHAAGNLVSQLERLCIQVAAGSCEQGIEIFDDRRIDEFISPEVVQIEQLPLDTLDTPGLGRQEFVDVVGQQPAIVRFHDFTIRSSTSPTIILARPTLRSMPSSRSEIFLMASR